MEVRPTQRRACANKAAAWSRALFGRRTRVECAACSAGFWRARCRLYSACRLGGGQRGSRPMSAPCAWSRRQSSFSCRHGAWVAFIEWQRVAWKVSVECRLCASLQRVLFGLAPQERLRAPPVPCVAARTDAFLALCSAPRRRAAGTHVMQEACLLTRLWLERSVLAQESAGASC